MVMHRRAYWIPSVNHQMGLVCDGIMCENTAEGVLELVTNTRFFKHYQLRVSRASNSQLFAKLVDLTPACGGIFSTWVT